MDAAATETVATHGLTAVLSIVGMWLLQMYTRRHQQSKEDRRDTIDEWKALYEQRGTDIARMQLLCGQLTDRLTAEQVRNGKLAAENKYVRERLAECGGSCDDSHPGG